MVVLLSLSSWCFLIVVWLFLVVPWVCLQFVIVVFPDHTHYLLLIYQFIARLGFKDMIRFELCHFLVTAHVIFVQSSTSTW